MITDFVPVGDQLQAISDLVRVFEYKNKLVEGFTKRYNVHYSRQTINIDAIFCSLYSIDIQD